MNESLFLGVKITTWLKVKQAADVRGITVEELVDRLEIVDPRQRYYDWAKHFGVEADIESYLDYEPR
jgi:hypothetical protein